MKLKLLLLATILLVVSSCKETKKGDSEQDSALDYSLFQKELPYEGMKGKIDSIVMNIFLAQATSNGYDKGYQIGKQIKHFDEKGYLVSDQYFTYDEEDGLTTASSVTNVRNEESLLNSYTSNFMSNTGQGSTSQYSLIDRFDNEEIWECIFKMDGSNLDVTAVVKHFFKDNMQILRQVNPASDSLVVEQSLDYNKKGMLVDLKSYSNDAVVYHQHNEFNNKGYIASTTTKRQAGSADMSQKAITTNESFEYEYDKKGNPQLVKSFEDAVIQAVMEYEIAYK